MLPKTISALPHTFGQLISYLFSGWRAKVITGTTAVATLFIIAQLFYTHQNLLLTLDWQLTPLWLLPTFLAISLQLLLGGFGWHLLICQSTHHNAPRQNIKIWWRSNLSRRLPGGIWYIASRAGLYDQFAISKRVISATSVLELIFIFTSGAIVALATTPFWLLVNTPYAWLWLLIIPIGITLIHPQFIAWAWPKINPITPCPIFSWPKIIGVLTYYVVVWLLAGAMVYSTINFFYSLSWVHLPSLIGMWAVSNLIATIGAFTIGGFGLRELSFTLLLAQLIPPPVAIVVALLIRVFWLIGELATALLAWEV